MSWRLATCLLAVLLTWALEARAEPVFDLPPLDVPSRSSDWWREPAVFVMAGDGSLSGEQRARRVLERLDVLAGRGEPAPAVVVDTSPGLPVLRAGGVTLVTVLPGDLPAHYRSLPPDKLRQAEMQLAGMWADALQRALDERARWHSPEYRWGAAIGVALLLLVALLASALVGWFAERFLATPMWSFRALIWLLWLAASLSLAPGLQGLQYALARGVLAPLWLLILAGIGSTVVFQVGRALIHRYYASLARLQERRRRLQAQRLASLEGAAAATPRTAPPMPAPTSPPRVIPPTTAT